MCIASSSKMVNNGLCALSGVRNTAFSTQAIRARGDAAVAAPGARVRADSAAAPSDSESDSPRRPGGRFFSARPARSHSPPRIRVPFAGSMEEQPHCRRAFLGREEKSTLLPPHRCLSVATSRPGAARPPLSPLRAAIRQVRCRTPMASSPYQPAFVPKDVAYRPLLAGSPFHFSRAPWFRF